MPTVNAHAVLTARTAGLRPPHRGPPFHPPFRPPVAARSSLCPPSPRPFSPVPWDDAQPFGMELSRGFPVGSVAAAGLWLRAEP